MECSVCGNEMQKEVSDGTSKNKLEETYDVVVVGAGHAGCEAALACVGDDHLYSQCGQHCVDAL